MNRCQKERWTPAYLLLIVRNGSVKASESSLFSVTPGRVEAPRRPRLVVILKHVFQTPILLTDVVRQTEQAEGGRSERRQPTRSKGVSPSDWFLSEIVGNGIASNSSRFHWSEGESNP